METDQTGGGAFRGVERSPSCRARRTSDPQRGRRALPGLEQRDPAASTRLLFRLGSEKSWHFMDQLWECPTLRGKNVGHAQVSDIEGKKVGIGD